MRSRRAHGFIGGQLDLRKRVMAKRLQQIPANNGLHSKLLLEITELRGEISYTAFSDFNAFDVLDDHPLPATDADQITEQGFPGEINLKRLISTAVPAEPVSIMAVSGTTVAR